MAEAETPFDVQCLEALKSIGKTLGQMSLYKIGHPAVSATLKTAEDHIASALAIAGGEELVYHVDHDKIIANGRIVGHLKQVPNSIGGLFLRFKLNSLTFRSGLADAELAAFIELVSSRTDSPLAADPKAFMDQRGVTHILFNEAIYSKVGAEKEAPPPDETAESKSQDEASETAIAEAAMRSLDDTIRVLVNKSVNDPLRREAVYKMVMQLLQQDIYLK